MALDALVALMPFAAELGLTLDEASADRVVARLDWAPRRSRRSGTRSRAGPPAGRAAGGPGAGQE